MVVNGPCAERYATPIGTEEDPMPLDRATTAVVLIEYQNDFTTEGGVLHSAVQPVMDKTAMLATRSVS